MLKGQKIGITVEARTGASRLPGKTLMPLYGKPMLARMIERLKKVKFVDEIVLATTDRPEDNALVDLAKQEGIGYYQGGSEDVLDRVLQAAKKYEIDLIVETCGDCPVIDPEILDNQIQAFFDNDVDYVGCHLVKTFPFGLDAKLFTTKILEEVSNITDEPADRENVSLYIYEHPEKYKLFNIEAQGRYRRPDLRLVVDYKEDFQLIGTIYQELHDKNPSFNFGDILDLFESRPELVGINKDVINVEVAGREH